MSPVDGWPIVTATQMRAAEEAHGDLWGLMDRAGRAVATAVRRLSAGAEVLILCGPGNNGGDGYVAATALAAAGHTVRVAALGKPCGELAGRARAGWTGPVAALGDAPSAPVVVDALFGTGLNRPLDRDDMGALQIYVDHARLAIALDLPSGLAADSGEELDQYGTPAFDLTLALGLLKPAHVLQPAADHCGTVRLLDLGLTSDGDRLDERWSVFALAAPRLPPPQLGDHKYTRGMVAVVAGRMHGAAELAAGAACRAGAGYVLLLTGGLPQPPHAIVRRPWSADALGDERIGAAVIGPGLGRDERAREKLAAALASDRPLVVDGDALHLLDLAALRAREAATILTPHAGEFAALFGTGGGGKLDRTRAAARRSGATVVHKGADTVIAAPDGSVSVSVDPQLRLATAGTGDVLAGTIAAILAQPTQVPFQAASAGVWLHTEAARLLGRPFVADDLLTTLPHAVVAATVHGR